MTSEHIDNRPADTVEGVAAEPADGAAKNIEENIIHVVVNRNHKAKLQLAKQLTEIGLSRKSIEKILNISDSQLS